MAVRGTPWLPPLAPLTGPECRDYPSVGEEGASNNHPARSDSGEWVGCFRPIGWRERPGRGACAGNRLAGYPESLPSCCHHDDDGWRGRALPRFHPLWLLPDRGFPHLPTGSDLLVWRQWAARTGGNPVVGGRDPPVEMGRGPEPGRWPGGNRWTPLEGEEHIRDLSPVMGGLLVMTGIVVVLQVPVIFRSDWANGWNSALWLANAIVMSASAYSQLRYGKGKIWIMEDGKTRIQWFVPEVRK